MTTESTTERRAGSDRRVRRLSFHVPERRSGFDRRLRERSTLHLAYLRLLDGYRRRPRVIAGVIVAFVALSVADFALTLAALDSGATEVNPIMAALLDASPSVAGAFKFAIAAVLAAGMWAGRRYRRVLEASLAVFVLMTALLAYHLALAARLTI